MTCYEMRLFEQFSAPPYIMKIKDILIKKKLFKMWPLEVKS
ncbi:hypothetical protein HMPREF0758_5057 [Serratia odorifera DSM 4582]|uniref:Uncharacterized protein n=1 Tax=Serratia odorifera DSM 4582 TaxID=667129 RepID=D4EA57_SEROD|nr:hypothetical protein HMPREF0758_5057 [Serratia odorifera DSM 4582]